MTMQKFITPDDYLVGTRKQEINDLIDGDQSILEKAEKKAVGYIYNHLQLYDRETIFSQTGDDRNETVLEWCLSYVLYYIYRRADDDTVPASVIKDYDDASEKLEKVSAGRYPLDLPRLEKTDLDGNPTTSTKTRFGKMDANERSVF